MVHLLAVASVLVMISGVALARPADNGPKTITVQRSGPDNTGSKLITVERSGPGEMATERYIDGHGRGMTTVTEPESGMTKSYRIEH